jgi:deoxyribose-phosphate aldolase
MSATNKYPEITESGRKLISLIDHTNLKPEATESDIRRLCEEALHYKFKAVCVNLCRAQVACSILKSSGIGIAIVTGFPLGAVSTLQKVKETAEAVMTGATEIDMVMNVGYLKDKEYRKVKEDIYSVVLSANGRTVKVILETCLLDNEEKITACQLSAEAGAHFVKTSTGFSSAGATESDVRLMRNTVGLKMGVKASGGIKTTETALKMVSAGANRLGTSAGIQIVTSD